LLGLRSVGSLSLQQNDSLCQSAADAVVATCPDCPVVELDDLDPDC